MITAVTAPAVSAVTRTSSANAASVVRLYFAYGVDVVSTADAEDDVEGSTRKNELLDTAPVAVTIWIESVVTLLPWGTATWGGLVGWLVG